MHGLKKGGAAVAAAELGPKESVSGLESTWNPMWVQRGGSPRGNMKTKLFKCQVLKLARLKYASKKPDNQQTLASLLPTTTHRH